MRIISPLLRVLLKRRNRRLVAVEPCRPTGIDIEEDLGILINRSQPLIFDVGANVGQSLMMFQRVFKAPRIHAFEPAEECFQKLEQHNWGDDVTLHRHALGDCCEERVFHHYELSVLNSLLPLARVTENEFREVEETGRSFVQTRTLDQIAESLNITQLDLLKIDTQGYDLPVIKGAQSLFQRKAVRHVMIEMNFVELYEGQCGAHAVWAELTHHGFALVDMYEKFRHNNQLAWCTALFVLKS